MASGAAQGAIHGATRVGGSWRELSGEYRLATLAAVGLFVSMFLPWYEQTATGVARGLPVTASDSLSAFQVFSWIEAAVLVVAVAVLLLCFTRGERRSFHLPGGDGTIVAAGGIWVCVLVFIRQLDKPAPDAVPGLSATMGVQWGIFVAFLFGLLMAYAGLRIRHAHRPEPDPRDEAMAAGRAPREQPRRERERPATRETRVMLPDEAPTRLAPADAAQAETGVVARQTPDPGPRPASTPAEPAHRRPAAPADEPSGEQLRFED